MFDLAALSEAITAHGRVARVVIAAHEGSSPREVGAAMLVWADGQSGTVGGGALEWEATARARELLSTRMVSGSPPARALLPSVGDGWGGGGPPHVARIALGPSLGQCCGGAVTLVTEVYTALPQTEAGVLARGPGAMPLAVRRVIARARGEGVMPAPQMVQGWFVEPVARADRALWVWGAGHVGRALVAVLAPLPGVAVTWVDVAADRFPHAVPEGVIPVVAGDPGLLVSHAPRDAEHLILTFSHALDLDLCHRLLAQGFARCGLIGSATKWARFRSRLAALGHAPAAIAAITCPIGDPALGKHPQAIAIGVAAAFLRASAATLDREMTA